MAIPMYLWVTHYLSLTTVLAYVGIFLVLANVANTLWYHRYCSHRSFVFSHPLIPRLCLWLNPLGYREEVYALVHHVHHRHADTDIDPNGRRLGWLGNYIASYFEIDTEVTEAEYERIRTRLAHIGMPFSSLASFRRWGCVESIPHYLARWAFATILWASLAWMAGGAPLLCTWFAVQFSWHAVVRDFNYRGHSPRPAGDERDRDHSTLARNQSFYGYLAGEWHNNHHAFRGSANCAFLRGQFDLPFQLIRGLKRLGLVARYNDHQEAFRKRFGDAAIDRSMTPAAGEAR